MRLRLTGCAVLSLLLLPARSTGAQRSGVDDGLKVTVGDQAVVAPDLAHRPLLEPYLVSQPGKPATLLAVSMVGVVDAAWRVANTGTGCSAFRSIDGGRSWRRHDFPVSTCADPWIVVTADGRAVASMLAVDTARSTGRALLLFRSNDAGETWTATPSVTPGRFDHPTLAVDTTSGARAGWIYLVSSILYRSPDGHERRGVSVARSRDLGATFDPATVLQPSNLFHNAEVPVVLADGTLVVSYTDTAWDNESEPQQRRAWVVRSRDGGRTFSLPEHVDERCGPPLFANAMLVAVPSNAQRERLYYGCNERGGARVVLAVSDTSERWRSLPARAEAPDSGATRQLRALAGSPDGTLGLMWVDRFGAGDAPRCMEVFFAASSDGGLTFSRPHRLTEGRACASRQANGALATAAPAGGDYHGLAAVSATGFRALWSEPRAGGAFRLVTAEITVRR